MVHRSNDDLVREIRDRRAKEIQECSERAAQKIHARLPKSKLSVDDLTEIISGEFNGLNR
jgi:hypothetical protein